MRWHAQSCALPCPLALWVDCADVPAGSGCGERGTLPRRNLPHGGVRGTPGAKAVANPCLGSMRLFCFVFSAAFHRQDRCFPDIVSLHVAV